MTGSRAPIAPVCTVELNGQPFATIHADPEVPSVELTSLEVDHPILDPVYKHGESSSIPRMRTLNPESGSIGSSEIGTIWVFLSRLWGKRGSTSKWTELSGSRSVVRIPDRSHPEQGSVWEDVMVELGCGA